MRLIDCGGFCFRCEYGSTWERCFKVVFRFVVGGILKRAFCLECGLC